MTQASGFRLRASGVLVMLASLAVTGLPAQNQNQSQQRIEWNQPQKPFKVFGNTYWVGTKGLGAVLNKGARRVCDITGNFTEGTTCYAINICGNDETLCVQ